MKEYKYAALSYIDSNRRLYFNKMWFNTLLVVMAMMRYLVAKEVVVYDVLKEPHDERQEFATFSDEVYDHIHDSYGHDEFLSILVNSLEEYNRINNGTNPTKAVLVLGRILFTSGYADYDKQNVPDSEVARFVVQYSTASSITLDCDKVSGPDRDLCLGALNTAGRNMCFRQTPMSGAEPEDKESAFHHVIKNPSDKLIWTNQLRNATNETLSYVKEYKRINDGTNPTKALVMYSRLEEIELNSWRGRTIELAEAMQRNSANDTFAMRGAEISAQFSFKLDCDAVSGQDYELCESIQSIPLFYLCAH